MSLLEGLEEYDIENASDNPFDLKDGTYDGFVTGFRVQDGEREDGSTYRGLIATLTPLEGTGIPFDYYMSYPTKGDTDKTIEIKKSSIKAFFVGCGVPASRIQSVTADEVIGTPITFVKTTTKSSKTGKTYSNVQIKVRNEDGESSSMSDIKSEDSDISDFDI